MLYSYSKKSCFLVVTAVVISGTVAFLNQGSEAALPEPVDMFSEAVVAAEHEVREMVELSTAGPGLVLNASLGTTKPKPLKVERGIASSYGKGFDGRKTANGEIYNQNTYTAAHKKLPFGTKVVVKNLRNGREVTLRINNRGPFVRGRIIDVSLRAARDLGMLKAGVVPVEVTILGKDGQRLQASH